MNFQTNHYESLHDLELRKLGLEDRISSLERDIRCPLEMDKSEQAGQLSQQMILRRLLEIELSNLRSIKFEIERRTQSN